MPILPACTCVLGQVEARADRSARQGSVTPDQARYAGGPAGSHLPGRVDVPHFNQRLQRFKVVFAPKSERTPHQNP